MFRIADQKTPQERMVQCVRWYMSAFHAGRRSAVAKKPYNPILGEIFRGYYDLPNVTPSEASFSPRPVRPGSDAMLSFSRTARIEAVFRILRFSCCPLTTLFYLFTIIGSPGESVGRPRVVGVEESSVLHRRAGLSSSSQ